MILPNELLSQLTDEELDDFKSALRDTIVDELITCRVYMTDRGLVIDADNEVILAFVAEYMILLGFQESLERRTA